MAMHITRPAPPVASVAPGMPRKLAQAIDRCLAKSPADRFPDGEALAECVSQAVEPKRELPVPLRLWLATGNESRLAYIGWYAFVGATLSAMAGGAVASVLGAPAGWVAGAGMYLLTPIAVHFGFRLRRLRRLLAEGYSADDARLAVRELAERRREELAYEFGDPPVWARAVRGVMYASGITAIGATAVLMRSPGSGIFAVAGVAALVWVGTAILQVLRPGKRVTGDVYVERRLRFWNSRFAKWFEKLAKLGLRRRAVPAELTYRPTELAIGLAADAMFDALPKDQRRELKELPSLIERLQRDAQLMRRTVDDLNRALAGLGDQSAAARSALIRDDAALSGTRARLQEDLTRRRDEASERLGAAVTALESIRLNLLRLRAGTGTVSELTADLEAARAAERDLAITAAARQEVETLLKGARAVTGDLRPATPHG